MKLLLDENISDKIVSRIADLYPGSEHVKTAGLAQADDEAIWKWARERGYAIVSKDIDFSQRAIVFGPPPKFIWLRVGNCATSMIIDLLRARQAIIREFLENDNDGVLVLERTA